MKPLINEILTKYNFPFILAHIAVKFIVNFLFMPLLSIYCNGLFCKAIVNFVFNLTRGRLILKNPKMRFVTPGLEPPRLVYIQG